MKSGEMIEVDWYDCTGVPGWENQEGAMELEPRMVSSVGYYIGENDYKLLLSTHVLAAHDDLDFGNISVIPLGCIFKMDILKRETNETC